MKVIGLMSGTSADGIDVALARISGGEQRLSAKLVNFLAVPFPSRVREVILRVAQAPHVTTQELSQLNFRLGELFAAATLRACRHFGVAPREIHLIGSHGQTVFHQGKPGSFLGSARVAATMQIGEGAVIAERTGITTISDFRPADIAAGGQGAPLVPFVDYLLYRDKKRTRIALNIGGIANVTVIPAPAASTRVLAFDTGPGNMIVDALAAHFSRGKQSCDKNARIAMRGNLLPDLLKLLLADPYFRQTPPKSAGREQFGAAFAERILAWGRQYKAEPADLIRTATLLTPLSIARAYRRFILPRIPAHEIIVSGGGARNPLILAQLSAALPEIPIVPSSHYGIPVDANEAFAFAILAYCSFHGFPNNLPSATGARHPVILGKISHAHRP
jgi:anhydro-N-acetylmuramic acid kinase